MKKVKKPTREQKKLIQAAGLDPEAWMVAENTKEYLDIVSRRELACCEMRRIEGVKRKPKTRRLSKTLMAVLAAGMMFSAGMDAHAASEAEVAAMAERIGAAYSLCPELLQAVAWHESHYDEDAENGGCIGLMQVSERWHRDRMARLQVADLHDPEGNMLVAADYLAELFAQYEDIGMVLMVYSGDSGAEELALTGEGLSEYVEEVTEYACLLERQHDK